MQITTKEASDLAYILVESNVQPKINGMMSAVFTYYCKHRLVMPQIPPFKQFKKILEPHLSDSDNIYIELRYTA